MYVLEVDFIVHVYMYVLEVDFIVHMYMYVLEVDFIVHKNNLFYKFPKSNIRICQGRSHQAGLIQKLRGDPSRVCYSKAKSWLESIIYSAGISAKFLS
jgi:hypothetical protein